MKLEMNIEQPSASAKLRRDEPFNNEHPMAAHVPRCIGYWMFVVGCWMFLLPALAVLPLSAQTASNPLPALLPAYPALPPTFWERHGTTMLISSLAFATLAIAGIWKILQPKAAVVLPPEVLAREALARRQQQPENGELLSEVSQILRRYLITALELPAGEMTTTEICTALARHEKIALELGDAISRFLRECDGRKFSPAGSDVPLNAVNRALELISLVERGRQPMPGQK